MVSKALAGEPSQLERCSIRQHCGFVSGQGTRKKQPVNANKRMFLSLHKVNQ